MSENKNELYMAQLSLSVIDYLTEQLEINTESLKQYEFDTILPNNSPIDVIKMREIEAIKLRDRIYELTRHISAIKRIIPFEYGKIDSKEKENTAAAIQPAAAVRTAKPARKAQERKAGAKPKN